MATEECNCKLCQEFNLKNRLYVALKKLPEFIGISFGRQSKIIIELYKSFEQSS